MRRTLLVLLALGLVAASFAGGGSAGAGTPVTEIRPDVVPMPTSHVRIRYVQDHKRLYLSFQVANTGSGPLEMRPVQDDCDGDGSTADDRTALQNVYGDTDGSGEYTSGSDTVLRSVVAGCFVFHGAHNHWHFDNFARYRLLSLEGERLRAHAKVGFCMLDTLSVDPSLPGYSGSRRYVGCPDLGIQGISVGWADVYTVDTPGQFISVEGIPNGTYCLVGRADPADRILEADETDNVVRTRVRFGDTEATIRPRAC